MEINYAGNQPKYMSKGAAGADLEANGEFVIPKGGKTLINTGTSLEIPQGFFGMVVPRSSICKGGLRLVNSVGIIDSDYRGDIMFCYENTSDEDIIIHSGTRIGQILILPFIKAGFKSKETLGETERGSGGFGSTGN